MNLVSSGTSVQTECAKNRVPTLSTVHSGFILDAVSTLLQRGDKNWGYSKKKSLLQQDEMFPTETFQHRKG